MPRRTAAQQPRGAMNSYLASTEASSAWQVAHVFERSLDDARESVTELVGQGWLVLVVRCGDIYKMAFFWWPSRCTSSSSDIRLRNLSVGEVSQSLCASR
jgi:hypothetical protein